MRNINSIIIHCSDSIFGNVEIIRNWHLQRKFSDIGYHYVILNGYSKTSKKYNETKNGEIEEGRHITKAGAHAVGLNTNSIGICLIGKDRFTVEQQLALTSIVLELMELYNISIENVLGHYESENANGKTCPNINMVKFREMLSKGICIQMNEFI